ncbi:MAG: lipase family protein [Burkholderiaceae bacterium]|nr:lipase family protein [Burkholderiaceae bacterium]
MSRYFKLGCMAIAAVWLVGCSSGSSGPDRGSLVAPAADGLVASMSAAQIDAAAAASGLQTLAGPAQCDVDIVNLAYRTIGAQGEDRVEGGDPVQVSGALLLPRGDCAGNPAPLLAYARGTDVQKTRTMADPQGGETFMLAALYAAQGYAVVATDYLGYAQSNYSFHPYLHADSEASAVIDSIRAARQAAEELGAPLSGKVVLSGYSQGGHSSMATHRAIERDLPGEIEVVAGAHLAGPYSLSSAFGEADLDNPIAGYQYFIPFIITAWQKVYGDIYTDPAAIFKAPYAAGIEDLLPSPTLDFTTLITSGALPGGTPVEAQDALFDRAYLQAIKDDPAHPMRVAAARNDLLDWTPVAPVLLCGGAGDPTVPPAMHQDVLMADFTARGVSNVTSIDVDPQIQAVYGPGGVAPTDPMSPEFATYYGSYHGVYEPPFCLAAARTFFQSALNPVQ